MRTLAAQSHLVAMIVLEVLLVLVPLAILTVLPHAAATASTGNLRAGWMLLAGGSALAYAVLLIAIHHPGVHHHGGAGNVVPLWPAIAAPIIGIGYWFGVLKTAAVLSLRTRRVVRGTRNCGARRAAVTVQCVGQLGPRRSAWDLCRVGPSTRRARHDGDLCGGAHPDRQRNAR
jgi:hypothetical protein